MDNSYILLLVIKKRINIATFIDYYQCRGMINYDMYLQYINDEYISVGVLSEFEFRYLVSYLSLIGELYG